MLSVYVSFCILSGLYDLLWLQDLQCAICVLRTNSKVKDEGCFQWLIEFYFVVDCSLHDKVVMGRFNIKVRN